MTDDDRKEIQAMIKQAVLTKDEIRSEIIKPLMMVSNANQEADRKVINQKLDTIIEQTTKHNQRMTKIEGRAEVSDEKIVELEKKEIAHVLNCPYNEDVRKLQDEALSVRSVKKWAAKTIAISVAIVTIISLLFGMLVRTIEFKKDESTAIHSSALSTNAPA